MTLDDKVSLYEPTLAFRAERAYIHSTDIYPEILRGAEQAGIQPAGPVDIKFRSSLTRQPRFSYMLASLGASVPAHAPVSFELNDREGRQWKGFAQQTERTVSQRKPYDEEPIRSAAVMEGQGIGIDAHLGLEPIEVITALGVYLHNQLMPPSRGKKWLLGRLKLDRPLETGDAYLLRLRLATSIGNSMSRTIVSNADGSFGEMTFILGSS